ncbi:C-type lectin lectoxin-Enh4-like [Dunckerocampus dactyliophorus]|uniref:C-type lectin lectoxin-Enh4-like n=1 Tax=Dunckerocampus dactyliophorus TaxID=161453 RepID=UPI002404F373|nr:C-type lectin lectoxin-Enh4-like [Dunckerocampus dactyliophorus]
MYLQKQTGHMKKMTGKVEDMTGQMKWMTQDVIEDLVMAAGRCPLPWVSHERGCYLLVHQKKTWSEAKEYCRGKGRHLASVHTRATSDFFYRLASGHDTWVGGYKEDRWWKWDDGSTYNVWEDGKGGSKYARWGAGEPDNLSGDEDCMEIWSPGGLNDQICYCMRPFICQL